jgi:hypothetical protein
MHITVRLFLLVLALVLFVLAGLGVPEHTRFRYIGFGLAAWTFASLLSMP